MLIDELIALTEKKNIPLYAMFELTHRCNFKCVHCYLGKAKTKNELDTGDVKKVLDKLAAAGTFFLTFTGGEIFVRNDIFDILSHAAKKGFVVTVFTNGYLLDKAKIKKIKACRVAEVCVSVYSMDSRVHDSITGVPGSLERIKKNLKELKSAGLHVRLKMPLMVPNADDYRKVIEFAKKNGFKWNIDTLLAPGNDGKGEQLKLRISEAKLRKALNDTALVPAVVRRKKSKEKDFFCSAGRNFCSVTPDGKLLPCIQILKPAGNIAEEQFSRAWNGKLMRSMREQRRSEITVCRTCGISRFCSRCPGLALLEDGDIKGPSSAACTLSRIRSEWQ